jgi:hypothetical protein
MQDIVPADPTWLERLAISDPQTFEQYAQLLDIELRERERALCENSLIEFFKRAWAVVESPHRPLSLNWHHYRMCENLESVSRGEIRNLIINIPPRHCRH